MSLQKRHLQWSDIEELVKILVATLPTNYDAMLVVARGGMVPGCLVSETMDIRNILVAAVMTYTAPGETLERPLFLQFPDDILLAGKRILVLDDVWDSGKTITAIQERLNAVGCHYDVATLHYKPAKSHFLTKPDYYASETDEWIVYPWDPTRDRE